MLLEDVKVKALNETSQMFGYFVSWSEATQCLEGGEGNGHLRLVVGVLVHLGSFLVEFFSMTL